MAVMSVKYIMLAGVTAMLAADKEVIQAEATSGEIKQTMNARNGPTQKCNE